VFNPHRQHHEISDLADISGLRSFLCKHHVSRPLGIITALQENRGRGELGRRLVCLSKPASAMMPHAATTRRQRRNLPHIVVGKAPAHLQHRADTFEKNASALDRHTVRSSRDDLQLMVGHANHAAAG